MSSTHLEFWYEFASTYSYPAAMIVADRAAEAGVEVMWRPFLLGPIFGEQGWNDSPFNIYPAKGRYMWRDLERICAAEGIPYVRPTAFPRNGLLAARLAVAGLDEAGRLPSPGWSTRPTSPATRTSPTVRSLARSSPPPAATPRPPSSRPRRTA